MRRLICWLLGHKYPAEFAEIGINGKVWGIGTCVRCGRKS